MSDTLSLQRQIYDIVSRLERLETAELPGIATTYTPTYDGTTPGTTTYTTQVGFYVKVGRLIFFWGRVTWTAASGTGTAVVSIPFTSDSTTNSRSTVGVYTTNVTFANGSIQAHIAPSTAFFVMLSPATNAAGTAIAVEAAGDIIFSGFFLAA